MPKSSLIVDATDQSGKKLQKTITNINPDVSNTVLASLGSMLVGLSDNTYGNTWRIDKTNCDAEAGGGMATPTLSLSATTAAWSTVKTDAGDSRAANYGYNAATVTYDGDAAVLYVSVSPVSSNLTAGVFYNSNDDKTYLLFRTAENTQTQPTVFPITVTVFAPETENYKAATATFTITAS